MKKNIYILLLLNLFSLAYSKPNIEEASAAVSAVALVISDGISLDTTDGVLDFGTIVVGNDGLIDLNQGEVGKVFIKGKWQNKSKTSTIMSRKNQSTSFNPSNSIVRIKYPSTATLSGEDGGKIIVKLTGW